MRAPKLIHLVPYGTQPHAHAFVSETAALAGSAARRGWRLEVVLTPAARDQEWIADVLAIGIPTHFVAAGSRIRATAAIAGLVEEAERVVLHTHHSAFDVPAAAGAARRPDARVIWHAHAALKPRLRLRNRVKYGLVARRVDRIVCVGSHVADQIVALGAAAEKVVVFENAIDGARFPPVTKAERDAARRDLGLPPDAIVLLHFAWDWRVKGGDLFLEALKLLRRRDQRVLGLTIGGGAAATDRIRRLDLGSSALVLPARPDVRVLYAAADVFVACSRTEGAPAPLAVLEALASGVPVAATRIPAQSSFTPDLPLYEVTDPDPADLARAIEGLLDRSDSLAPARASVHERLDRYLNIDAWSEGLFEIYESSFVGRG